ncbi:hypothetical protein T492DRAFT_847567 [Pavlovales sp. CCMP2436]|nr:hypothetical protein T492DRAFT_847567 [Pavlovales sp. CCMP2436]
MSVVLASASGAGKTPIAAAAAAVARVAAVAVAVAAAAVVASVGPSLADRERVRLTVGLAHYANAALCASDVGLASAADGALRALTRDAHARTAIRGAEEAERARHDAVAVAAAGSAAAAGGAGGGAGGAAGSESEFGCWWPALAAETLPADVCAGVRVAYAAILTPSLSPFLFPGPIPRAGVRAADADDWRGDGPAATGFPTAPGTSSASPERILPMGAERGGPSQIPPDASSRELRPDALQDEQDESKTHIRTSSYSLSPFAAIFCPCFKNNKKFFWGPEKQDAQQDEQVAL